MYKPSFTQIWIAFKAFSSKSVLKVGNGVKFIISLIASILLLLLLYAFYVIPVRDVQFFLHQVYGLSNPYNVNLSLNMDYGGGVTSTYKNDFERGVILDITNDYEWEKRDTFAFSACYQTAYRQGGNVIRSFDYSPVDLLRILQAEIPNDTDVIKVLFASHIIESKVPRLRYSYNGERKGCFEQTATFQRIGLPDSLVDYKTPYHIIMTEGRDSITGLNSAMTTCYFANTEAGWMRVNLPTSRNFVEASIIELYDISQCYYHLTLNMTRYSSKRSLSLDFGGATEFSHMDPEPDKITMSGIVFTDSLKIDQIGHNGLWMHAKFKQLENIQIIRMFAVTTALGFFIAVLFASGWKWLARRSRRYIAKEKLKKIAKEQMDKDG